MHRRALLIAAAALALQASPANAQRSSEVGATRNEVGRSIGMNQYIQLSQDVVTQMLASPQFARVVETRTRPRIVVASAVNNSEDHRVRASDIEMNLRDALVASDLVDLYAYGATDVDLVLAPEFTSTTVVGDRGRREYTYSFTVTLTAPDGRYLGAWTAHQAYVR